MNDTITFKAFNLSIGSNLFSTMRIEHLHVYRSLHVNVVTNTPSIKLMTLQFKIAKYNFTIKIATSHKNIYTTQ